MSNIMPTHVKISIELDIRELFLKHVRKKSKWEITHKSHIHPVFNVVLTLQIQLKFNIDKLY